MTASDKSLQKEIKTLKINKYKKDIQNNAPRAPEDSILYFLT